MVKKEKRNECGVPRILLVLLQRQQEKCAQKTAVLAGLAAMAQPWQKTKENETEAPNKWFLRVKQDQTFFCGQSLS